MPINYLQTLMMNQSFKGKIEEMKYITPNMGEEKMAKMHIEYSLDRDGFYVERHEAVINHAWKRDGWYKTSYHFYHVAEFEALWKKLKSEFEDVQFKITEINSNSKTSKKNYCNCRGSWDY